MLKNEAISQWREVIIYFLLNVISSMIIITSLGFFTNKMPEYILYLWKAKS